MAGKADQNEQLSAYLDGELSAEERRAVEEWLDREPKARQLLDELRRVSGLVASLPREPAPADLADSVKSRFEREALLGETASRPAVSGPRFLRWATRLGAVAVLAIGGTLAWYSVETMQDQPAVGTAAHRNTTLDEDAEDSAGTDVASVETAESVAKDELAQPAAPAAESPERRMTGARGRRGPARSAKPDGKGEEKMAARGGRGAAKGERAGRRNVASTKGERAESLSVSASAAEPRMTLDAKLRNNSLTYADLRNVGDAPASNVIRVETDTQSAMAMVEVINGFMYANGIPPAEQGRVPEPIPPRQLFYFNVARAPSEQEAPEASTEPQPDVFVMNLEPQQAELLLVSLQSFATLNRSDVEWRANWVDDEKPQQVQEIIRSIGKDLSPPAAAPTTGLTVGEMYASTEDAVAEPKASKGERADEEDVPVASTRRAKRRRGATSRDSEQIAPITLAVEIRARSVNGASRVLQFPPPREDESPPLTSQPAEEGATATQPTSQRSEGG